jgi:hypothetical protein
MRSMAKPNQGPTSFHRGTSSFPEPDQLLYSPRSSPLSQVWGRPVKREVAEFDSYLDAVETFLAQPWSDGLPTIPPTPELVEAMIAGGGRDADALIGSIPARQMSLHVWEAATCAVMAGCRPEYFPVVLATWDAMFDLRFNVHSAISSTSGPAIAAVVSGAYADTIGMNSGIGVFGPGNRPNATIGRAIRIGAMSVLKAIPDQLDAGSFGHGGKYSFHFAERTPPPQWQSIREQLGFDASATTVTVMAVSAPRQISHRWNPTPEGFLRTVAAAMKDPSKNTTGAESAYMVVLGPEHASVLAEGGLTTRQISETLSEFSKVTKAEMSAAGIQYEFASSRFSKPDAEGRMLTVRPEHVLVMTAGGYGSGWSAVIPAYTGLHAGHPATRAIVLPGQGPQTARRPVTYPDYA